MIINNVQDLTKLMGDINSWDILDEHTFAAVQNGEYTDDDSISYEVPSSVLAQLHPDFPLALRAQIEWSQQTPSSVMPVTYGSCVIDNLALLKRGSYAFTDTIGLTHTLVNISNVHLRNDGSSASIVGSQCHMKTIESNGRLIPFVTTSRHYCSTQVDAAALDREYPGWKIRWDIGDNLGLPFEELLPYVFEQPTPHVSSSGIIFE